MVENGAAAALSRGGLMYVDFSLLVDYSCKNASISIQIVIIPSYNTNYIVLVLRYCAQWLLSLARCLLLLVVVLVLPLLLPYRRARHSVLSLYALLAVRSALFAELR